VTITEPEDDERNWRRLVANYEALHTAYLDVASGDTPKHRAASRALWGAISDLFWFYASTTNWRDFYHPDYEEGRPRFALPSGAAMFIASCAGVLQVGAAPAVVDRVKGRGRTAPTPAERHDIAVAAAYVQAAKLKLIDDGRFVSTVCEAYGIGRSTVNDWVRTAPAFDRDMWALPGELLDAFERAARRYRDVGRSESALRRRQRKRPRK
jgi:hypothetical protein